MHCNLSGGYSLTLGCPRLVRLPRGGANLRLSKELGKSCDHQPGFGGSLAGPQALIIKSKSF
jgi:hypothetical protein